MNTFQRFSELNIPDPIKQSLDEMGFETPTPIQAQAIPASLEGKDIVGTAQTGTGKTGAFGVPLMTTVFNNPGKVALVLAPTRELAHQITKVLRSLGRRALMKGSLVVGGESFRRQVDEMARDVDYIVATPGRLNDHINEGTVDLSTVGVLVLDEVDRMLDMGFLPQIKEIIRHIPKERQTLLYSATLPKDVMRFVDTLVKNPIRVEVGDVARPTSQVEEKVIQVEADDKLRPLMEILEARQGKVLVFVRTQSRTFRLMRELERKNIPAVCLHGGRTQGQRKQALDCFRRGSHPVMVATDLAGRGLDIVDIELVVNFDAPSSREDYIHRIGRTGRAGTTGKAVSFVVKGDTYEEKIVTGKGPKSPQGSYPARRPGRPGGFKKKFKTGGSKEHRKGPRKEFQKKWGQKRSGEKPAFAPRREFRPSAKTDSRTDSKRN